MDDIIKDVIYLSGFIVLSLSFLLFTSTFTRGRNLAKLTPSLMFSKQFDLTWKTASG